MTFLQSWILFPVVVVVLSTGAGLLVERVARPTLPGALVAPVGFALLMVVSALFTWKEPTSGLAAPALVVVAIAGLVVGRDRLVGWARAPRGLLWPAVAALLPFAAFALPVVLTGMPGLTGYGRIVDLAFQLDYTAWLQDAGQTHAPSGDSSFLQVVEKMVAIGYPGGGQALLGSLAGVARLDPLWAWQPFMASLAGVLGVSLFVVLRSAIPSAPWRALAAGVAAQPTALYSYGLTSGIKEVAGSALIALVVATLVAHRPGDGPPRAVAPLAVAAAAAFAALSVGALPWIGMACLVVFVADVVLRKTERGPAFAAWVLAGVLAAVLAVPAVVASVRLAPVAASGGPGGLGNLAAPVPVWSAVGPWLTGDYRFPLEQGGAPTPTYILVALGLALAAVGFVSAVRRRDLGVLALAIAGVVALAYVVRASAEWSDFKAYVISAPAILATALAGAAWLARLRPRALGLLGAAAGVVLAGGVLVGNAVVYHDTSLAPYDRFADLEEINDRYAGQGPSLYPVFDEYAEYLLRDVQASGLVNPANFDPGLGPAANGGLQFVRDPDEYSRSYLDTRRLLIIRRDPTLSRPPGNFRLVERTRYHDVWRREEGGPRILAHVPVGNPNDSKVPACAELRAALRDAPAGARVRYAQAPTLVQFGADQSGVPTSWRSTPPDFIAGGPGRIRGTTELPAAGRYSIWLRGSFGRPVQVRVDGKLVGSVRWKESYPGYYAHLDVRELAAGEHRVEIYRGGGDLLPGTGNEVGGNTIALVGPAAFLAEQPQELRTVSAREGEEICRSDTPLDWLEVIEG